MAIEASRRAADPFEFKSAEHLLFIEKERACNIGELARALRSCPEGSIFQHTFRTLEEHHFIKEGFSNDFAHWAYVELGKVGLGERLASLDVREFTSLVDTAFPSYRNGGGLWGTKSQITRPRRPGAPFYFCSSKIIILPPQRQVNLAEFIEGLRAVSVHSIHYHFIEARLRRKLESNDFSIWLQQRLGHSAAGAQLNQIDIYTSTLEGVRAKDHPDPAERIRLGMSHKVKTDNGRDCVDSNRLGRSAAAGAETITEVQPSPRCASTAKAAHLRHTTRQLHLRATCRLRSRSSANRNSTSSVFWPSLAQESREDGELNRRGRRSCRDAESAGAALGGDRR